MNVFLLQPDFDYKEIDLSPLDIEDIFPENITLESILDFSKHNMALKEFWSAIKVDFAGKSEVQHVPDIGIWMGGVLLLSPATKIFVANVLQPFGEFLPITIHAEEWFLFNCTTVASAEVIVDGTIAINLKDNSLNNAPIFKVIVNGKASLYCTEKFKRLLSDYNLKGLQVKIYKQDLVTCTKQPITALS